MDSQHPLHSLFNLLSSCRSNTNQCIRYKVFYRIRFCEFWSVNSCGCNEVAIFRLFFFSSFLWWFLCDNDNSDVDVSLCTYVCVQTTDSFLFIAVFSLYLLSLTAVCKPDWPFGTLKLHSTLQLCKPSIHCIIFSWKSDKAFLVVLVWCSQCDCEFQMSQSIYLWAPILHTSQTCSVTLMLS